MLFVTWQIFETSAFKYNEEVAKGYFKSESITIPEVYGSPQKRRVPVEGHVLEVNFSFLFLSVGFDDKL